MSLLEKDTPDVEAGCTVSDLRVALTGRGRRRRRRDQHRAAPGEVVGLVGESGSGKTTAGTALLAYARRGAFIERGKVMFEGQDVLELSSEQVREIRGMKIAYVPQDPAAALNPAIRIGRQIVELLELHGIGTAEERLDRGPRRAARGRPARRRRVPRPLRRTSCPAARCSASRWRWRSCRGPRCWCSTSRPPAWTSPPRAWCCRPWASCAAATGVAALYVTHDLAVVANIADRVAVMYAGQIIELGPRDAMFRQPAHPYTRALLDAIPHLSPGPRAHRHPRLARPGPGGARPPAGSTTAASTPRTAAARSSRSDVQVGPDHTAQVPAGRRDRHLGHQPRQHAPTPTRTPQRDIILTVDDLKVFYGRKEVVHGVSFDVAKAEVVALVGESGSGKTTISRCVGGLHKQWTGEITFEGRPLGKGSRARSAEDRKRIQYIFQNPYLSLNPRLTIEQIVERPMELFGIAKGKAARDRVVELLDAVALGPTVLDLQTNRLSGGERQRVAIARALAAEPDLLVCDEITSALDVSVQGSIVALLEDLRKTRADQHAVRHPQPGPGPLDRRPGAGPQRGRAGRVRLRRRGDGHAQGGLHQAAARQQPAVD